MNIATYRAQLRRQPDDADSWHALGLLYARDSKLRAAAFCLHKTMALQPADLAIPLHLANVRRAQGRLDEAAHLLTTLLQRAPDYLPAYNNLGVLHYAAARYPEAIHILQQAVHKAPTYIDAWYNLGLAQLKAADPAAAAASFAALLKISDTHLAARFHYGCALMAQHNFAAARDMFLSIENQQTEHAETKINLAHCYVHTGDLRAARHTYHAALSLQPDDAQILFNLGVISAQLGEPDHAIQYYQRALQQEGDLFAAHYNVGVLFLARHYPALALPHFKAAARLQPDNSTVQYLLTMLSDKRHLLAAPPEYIQSLFNGYADHYDAHLLHALDYALPDIFINAIQSELLKTNQWDIVDLGCGTGLCAAPFKPYAQTLTGVDLAEKMLDQARAKNIYTDLICDNIDHFLTNTDKNYHLILTGDTLVYLGDLGEIFARVKRVLRPHGLWLFNTEITTAREDYQMQQSGRFGHHENYILRLAKENDLHCVQHTKIHSRTQVDKPVDGYLFVLRQKELA